MYLMKINLLKDINDYQINATKSLLVPFALTVIFGGLIEKISNKNMDILKLHFLPVFIFLLNLVPVRRCTQDGRKDIQLK